MKINGILPIAVEREDGGERQIKIKAMGTSTTNGTKPMSIKTIISVKYAIPANSPTLDKYGHR